MIIQPHNATLVYHDVYGNAHTQPLTDVAASGTLIDSHSDNDMAIDHIIVEQESDTDNTLSKPATEAILVYVDDHGIEIHQSLSELVSIGTLIDPYTDDDMTIDHVIILFPTKTHKEDSSMTNSTKKSIFINADSLNAYVALGKLEHAAYAGVNNDRARNFVQHISTLVFDALPFSPKATTLDNTRIIDAHEAVDELEYAASLNVKNPQEDQQITTSLKAIRSELPPKPVTPH